MNRHLVITLLVACTSIQGSQENPSAQHARPASDGDLLRLSSACKLTRINTDFPAQVRAIRAGDLESKKRAPFSATSDEANKILARTCAGIFFGSLTLAIVVIAGLIQHVNESMSN